jgi:hypothetical protein
MSGKLWPKRSFASNSIDNCRETTGIHLTGTLDMLSSHSYQQTLITMGKRVSGY